MQHVRRFKLSWGQFWKNPSLIVISLIKVLVMFIIAGVFAFLGTALAASGSYTAGLILLLFFIVELLIFIFLNGYFSAGFYSMVRNVIQDGGTSFREFFPGAKRYWLRFSGYIAIRWVILLILMTPFLIAVFSSYMALTPGLGPTVVATLVFFVLSSLLIIFFWMLWGEAAMVFEDMKVWQAIKYSFRTANANIVETVTVVLISFLMAIIAFGVLLAILVPYQAFLVAPTIGSLPLIQATLLDLVIDVITYAVFLSVFVVIMLFIFRTYEQITGRKRIKRKVRKAKTRSKRK